MTFDWASILTSAGITAPVLLAGAWFLTKQLVDKRFKHDLEEYKAALARQLEAEKAQLALTNAAQLQAMKTEAEVVLEDLRSSRRRAEAHLTKLDERRANVLAELYAKIVRARMVMSEVLRPEQSVDGKNPSAAKRARDALDEARRYFAEHEIFVHGETGEAVGKWLQAADVVLHQLEQPVKPGDYKQVQKRLQAASFGYGELGNIHALIAREIRSLLGVHPGPLGERFETDVSVPMGHPGIESVESPEKANGDASQPKAEPEPSRERADP